MIPAVALWTLQCWCTKNSLDCAWIAACAEGREEMPLSLAQRIEQVSKGHVPATTASWPRLQRIPELVAPDGARPARSVPHGRGMDTQPATTAARGGRRPKHPDHALNRALARAGRTMDGIAPELPVVTGKEPVGEQEFGVTHGTVGRWVEGTRALPLEMLEVFRGFLPPDPDHPKRPNVWELKAWAWVRDYKTGEEWRQGDPTPKKVRRRRKAVAT